MHTLDRDGARLPLGPSRTLAMIYASPVHRRPLVPRRPPTVGRRGASRPRFDGLMTGALLLVLVGLAALVGKLALGTVGLWFAALAVAVLVGAGLSLPPTVMMRLTGAVPLAPQHAPWLARLVLRLARRADVAPPSLFLIDAPVANAMAAGDRRREGALAITTGALSLLPPDELEAVLAHEIAHLRHGDTTILRFTQTVARITVQALQVGTWVAVFALLVSGTGMERVSLLALLGLLVPPVVAYLTAALSRTRELAADRTAAELTGRPDALARALVRLDRHHERRRWPVLLRAPEPPPWLRSHPATAERVERLLA